MSVSLHKFPSVLFSQQRCRTLHLTPHQQRTNTMSTRILEVGTKQVAFNIGLYIAYTWYICNVLWLLCRM